MENINYKVKKSTRWSVFTEVVVKIISPITNMILARLLAPEVFGVVATVTMITSFSDILTDAGFQKFIIQRKFENDDEQDLCICVAFWTNLTISCLLWLLIWLFSNQIASLVGNPGLGNMVSVASMVLVLTSFSSIQMSVYRKNFDFKTLSVTRITSKLIPFVITIPLVLLGFTYWALIVGNLVGELLNVIILTALSKWRPKFRYDFNKLLQMFSFCGWTFMESVSGWIVSNVGIFIIGFFFSNYYLGIYKTSITTVSQIVSILSASTINVLFAALSALQDESKEYNKMVLSFQKYVGMFSIPLGIGIFVFRDTITCILLGNQWHDATLLVGVWGLIICESVIFADFGATILLAKGKPQYIFISNLVQIVILIPTLLWSSYQSFTCLVYAICLVRIQLPFMQMFWVNHITGIKGKEILKNISPYILSGCIMGAIGYCLRYFKTSLVLDIVYIILCVVVYFAILFSIAETRKDIKVFLNKVKLSTNKKK